MLKLKPGDTVDRYVIEEVIGRGGMGCVYRAQDSRLHRKVALKMLLAPSEDEHEHEASSPSSDAAARMLREARATASFDHPNAVQVFDVGERDGTPYIAMELIVGQTLTALVTDDHFAWPTRLRWLVDAARALGAAHRAGLIHRDVKPDNVMVRKDGVTKVLDFGIVRHAGPLNPLASTLPVGFPSLTQRGSVLGTPHYMAPEQIRGLALDARADQFSWGVMAFELLTQKMPWGTGLEAISLALTSPAPSLRDGCPELPAAVNAAIERALAKVPDDRFATMDELAAAIEPFAAAPVNPGDASGPVSSISLAAGRLPTTGGGHATPLHQKRSTTARTRLYGAGVLVLVLGAGAVYAASRSRQPTPVASAPPQSSAVTMMDLPRPTSAKPEALAAYLAGLQAIRDGSRPLAIEAFTRAVTLDPSIGAAHLRLALAGYVESPTTARQEFEKAEGLRSTMSEHDQALLVAMEPEIQRQPADWVETQARLNAAIAKFPGDADLLFQLGGAAFLIDPAAAGPPLDAALAADPKFAFAWAFKAEALAYLGDFEGAGRGLGACLKISPGAVSCISRHIELDEIQGDCAAKEKDARTIATVNPSSATGYLILAETLLSVGRPVEAVRELIKQGEASITDEGERLRTKLRYEISLDLWTGDFSKAERHAHDLERAAAPILAEEDHAFAARRLLEIYAETGRPKEAGQIAATYFAKREAWAAYPMAEDWAVAADPTPLLLEAELRAALITPAAFEAARSTWIAGWKTKLSPFFARYLWENGFAAPAQTPAEAKDALAQLASLGPLPPFRPLSQAEASIGRTFLLAGDPAQALTYLKIATRACRALEFPAETTRAYYTLGLALEAAGDPAGACAAYAPVIQRWGSSRSLTAAKAKARTHALACPK